MITISVKHHPTTKQPSLFWGLTFLLCLGLLAFIPAKSLAQIPSSLEDIFAKDSKSPTVIEADELIYFERQNRVRLLGDVRINRAGFTLLGEAIDIDLQNKRLRSNSHVVLIDGLGNRAEADLLNLKFDLSEGMIEGIKLKSVDSHQVEAKTSVRDGDIVTFQDATYTTCEACKDDPSKPRQWSIEAREIKEDLKEGTTTLRDVRLNLFGFPVFYLPYLKTVSPLVERRSGFLLPKIRRSKELGIIGAARYHAALAPNYDLTIEAGAAQERLFYSTLDWRHLTPRGSYHIRPIIAYASDLARLDPIIGEKLTFGLQTEGQLHITQDWDARWNILTTNSPRLLRELNFVDFDKRELELRAELINIKERNLTKIGVYGYQPLEVFSGIDQQATLLPRAIHNQFLEAPIIGGELEWQTEFQALARPDSQFKPLNDFCDVNNPDPVNCLLVGAEGEKVRFSTSASWKKRHILAGGQVVTAFAQGSLHAEKANIDRQIARTFGLSNDDNTKVNLRALAGLEYRLPLVNDAGNRRDIIEPVFQIIAATDRSRHTDSATNETAQSVVLEPTSLFKWNRFSSDEKWETGVRINYGLEHTSLFSSGPSIRTFIGQSAHLAGTNAFDVTGNALHANSGLEGKFSDVIAGIDFHLDETYSLDSRVQVDPYDFDIGRFELGATAKTKYGGGTLRFVHVEGKPQAGFPSSEKQVTLDGYIVPYENWKITGSTNFDIQSQELISRGLGLHYDDQCFGFDLSYKAIYLDGVDRNLTEVFSIGIELKPFDGLGYSTR